jgi:two-component system, cell cycle response regulator
MFFFLCNGRIAFIAEPRRMSDSEVIIRMTDLNNELANLWRELTRKNVELEKANETIGRLLNTDVLTGIPNRRALEQFIADRFALEMERPFSLVMADIDHFKKVNDTYGHHAGDVVLASLGEILSGQTRSKDMAGRYGGEEFLVAMPRTGLKEAAGIAERIRAEVEKSVVEEDRLRITASFGVAEAKGDENWESLVRRADEALYLAKDSGRNNVAISS